MTATMLAVDLGAESGRVIGGRFDGERLHLAEPHRFPTRSLRLPDGLYWDALGLYGDVIGALGDERAKGPVRSVGIDSWAVDFGLLDETGALIQNPLSYRDGRGATAVDDVLATVSFAELYAATGIQLLPINTLFQLRALGSLDSAATMLLIPDLLGYWLTGERVAEATNASTTQLFAANGSDWAWDVIGRLELPPRLFPRIAEPGAVMGAVLKAVAEPIGLSASTPVVNVASHDTASAVVAAPLVSDGAAYISSGTWSLVGLELPHPILSDAAREANLTNERGFDGTTRLLKNVMGLWLLQECRRAWELEGRRIAYHDLAALAGPAPTTFLFDPDLPEFLAPGEMPARICVAAGLPDADDVSAVVRAIFDSLACKYRLVIEQLEEVTGRRVEVINVIGGGARNDVLCQLTANVSGRAVVAGPAEASALGNLLVQLRAFGDVGPLADMRRIVAASSSLVEFEPDPGRGRWEDLYQRFCGILRPKVVAP